METSSDVQHPRASYAWQQGFFCFLLLMCHSPRGITMVTVGASYIIGANLQLEMHSEMVFNY